jgi:ParB-like chromosome segregation protein Spo0J
MTVTKTLGWRRPEDLKPHRLQNVAITDVDDATLERLKIDLDKNGQQQAIEITPDDVIVDGAQRRRAAIQLGWEQVRVWIRSDLTDELAVEKRFIEANLNRRQMTKLEMARAYVAMKDTERRQRAKQRFGDSCKLPPLIKQRDDLRNVLGKLFGCSGRTLDRYACVLNAPIEVQQAFQRGELKLEEAGRVALYSESRQQQIAERIRSGEDAKQVVETLAKKRERRKFWGPVVGRVFRQAEQGADELRRNRAEVEKCLRTSDLPRLRKLRKHFDSMIKYIEKNPDKCKSTEERIADAAAKFGAGN